MDNPSPAKLFISITERQWQMKVLEMVVKGFDGLTGIALFVSAFGLGFGGSPNYLGVDIGVNFHRT